MKHLKWRQPKQRNTRKNLKVFPAHPRSIITYFPTDTIACSGLYSYIISIVTRAYITFELCNVLTSCCQRTGFTYNDLNTFLPLNRNSNFTFHSQILRTHFLKQNENINSLFLSHSEKKIVEQHRLSYVAKRYLNLYMDVLNPMMPLLYRGVSRE